VEGFETETATLTCDLSKSGRTDGQWTFNGQPLTPSERIQLKVDGFQQTVEFGELTLTDAGQYSYSIENASTSATLTVRGMCRVGMWGVSIVRLLSPEWSLYPVQDATQVTVMQWFLTWGPETPWGSQTPILGVPNANLEYQQQQSH